MFVISTLHFLSFFSVRDLCTVMKIPANTTKLLIKQDHTSDKFERILNEIGIRTLPKSIAWNLIDQMNSHRK